MNNIRRNTCSYCISIKIKMVMIQDLPHRLLVIVVLLLLLCSGQLLTSCSCFLRSSFSCSINLFAWLLLLHGCKLFQPFFDINWSFFLSWFRPSSFIYSIGIVVCLLLLRFFYLLLLILLFLLFWCLWLPTCCIVFLLSLSIDIFFLLLFSLCKRTCNVSELTKLLDRSQHADFLSKIVTQHKTFEKIIQQYTRAQLPGTISCNGCANNACD